MSTATSAGGGSTSSVTEFLTNFDGHGNSWMLSATEDGRGRNGAVDRCAAWRARNTPAALAAIRPAVQEDNRIVIGRPFDAAGHTPSSPVLHATSAAAVAASASTSSSVCAFDQWSHQLKTAPRVVPGAAKTCTEIFSAAKC